MSITKNETSIPNQRGRKQLLKGKRLSNKRVRKLSFDSSYEEIKIVHKSFKLDK